MDFLLGFNFEPQFLNLLFNVYCLFQTQTGTQAQNNTDSIKTEANTETSIYQMFN